MENIDGRERISGMSYDYQLEKVLESEKVKLLWEFNMQTGRQIGHSKLLRYSFDKVSR